MFIICYIDALRFSEDVLTHYLKLERQKSLVKRREKAFKKRVEKLDKESIVKSSNESCDDSSSSNAVSTMNEAIVDHMEGVNDDKTCLDVSTTSQGQSQSQRSSKRIRADKNLDVNVFYNSINSPTRQGGRRSHIKVNDDSMNDFPLSFMSKIQQIRWMEVSLLS